MGSALLSSASPSRTWYDASVRGVNPKPFETVPRFTLFTVSPQVRRHHFMGTQVMKVFPAKEDEVRTERGGDTARCRWLCVDTHPLLFEQHAGIALSALVRALDGLNMAAIVRYAYNSISSPQVGAAFPCIKKDYEVRSEQSSPKGQCGGFSSIWLCSCGLQPTEYPYSHPSLSKTENIFHVCY